MEAQTNDIDVKASQFLDRDQNDVLNVEVTTETSPTPEIDYNDHDDDKSTNSEVSEIARLADVSISEENLDPGDAPPIRAFAEISQEKEILNVIEVVQMTGSTSIDLRKRNLQSFPNCLSHLPHLEYMYLEGNKIVHLPDDFFKMFPNLRWLDLRNNLLRRIPTAYLSSHSSLRDLLLEGNNLHNLPIELGLVKTLQGLNISGNPLEFPPMEIIEKGTKHVLLFLQSLHEISCANLANMDLNLSDEATPGCEHMSVSIDDWNTTASMMDLAKKREMVFKYRSEFSANPEHALAKEILNETKAGNCHVPSDYPKSKLKDLGKIKKTQVSQVRKKKKESKLAWRLNPYPPLPTQDYVAFRAKEEKHLAKVKELNNKIEALIQKQKDESTLKKWRDVAKMLQQKKYSKRLIPGKDYQEPGEQAPFGIEADMMKVLSKEDRLKADLQKEAELRRQREVSPAIKMRKEQEKQQRILDLERKVQEHTAAMLERRKKPKNTPQQEMTIAKRELQIAEQLHNELQAERRDVEYHIKTFPSHAAKKVKGNTSHLLN